MKKILKYLDLKKTEPEFKNPQDLIRRKNIEGINEISIFNDSLHLILKIDLHLRFLPFFTRVGETLF
ncbi:hypothetical protein BXU01_01520 [[Flexibacter] sp. ATCC 35103]|nr:hypothetical protein BXU01_01520 [[Flexibacter] sp. ATCC 35103]